MALQRSPGSQPRASSPPAIAAATDTPVQLLAPRDGAGVVDGITRAVLERMAIDVHAWGAECSTLEPPPLFGRNEAELQTRTSALIDDVTGCRVSVKGRDVGDLAA
jgi:hypothetical protein